MYIQIHCVGLAIIHIHIMTRWLQCISGILLMTIIQLLVFLGNKQSHSLFGELN